MQSIKKLRIEMVSNQFASRALMIIGGACVFVGLTMGVLTFGPALKEEVRYRFVTVRNPVVRPPTPIDSSFSIQVPRIGANVKVIPNVDPYNEKEYQQQLAKGVAHARGTVFPGQVGNTFLFAHSSRNWEIANQYNAVFFLLYKLKTGDDIYVTYQKNTYHYLVKEMKYVDANEVKYLSPDTKQKTLTLMTCWPPGTTLRRLIVTAEIAP